jgi:Omp85 superfamily domain
LQLKIQHILKLNHFVLLIAFLALGTSCNTGKYLKEDESFVNKNIIKFDTKQTIEKKRYLAYELSTLCKQKPNDKVLWLFKTRLWFHYKTNKPQDTTKIDNWIQKVIAEPPSILDSLQTWESAKAMEYFLQHRGYYNAKVTIELKRKKNKSTVTYHINPYQIHTIDSVFLSSKDANIQRILNDTKDETFLKRGDPVSVGAYSQEVERITKILKNLGYAYFDRRFVDKLKGDSSDYKVNLYLKVLTPPDRKIHEVFKIGKILIYDGYNPKEIQSNFRDSLIDGIHFMVNGNNTIVKAQTILHSIYIKEGDLYQEDNFIKTNRQLRTLEIYKFVSIKTFKDSLENGKINFIIRLTPKQKIVVGADIEVNNSNYNSGSGRTLLGTAISLNIKNRNFVKTASVLSAQLHGGVEFDIGNPSEFLYSIDILASANWQIPKFVEFPKTLGLLNKTKIIPNRFYNGMIEKAQSKVSASYNRLLLFDFYNYHSFNATFGYDYRATGNKRFILNQIGINYLFPVAETGFQEILDNNPFLAKTFVEQLFTGLFFRDISYLFSSKPNVLGKSIGLRTNFEISGLEVFLVNKAYNAVFSHTEPFKLFGSVEYSQYMRLEAAFMHTKNFDKKQSIAWRISSSIAAPYGFSKDIGVPYVKQFYSGGPNSIRAWRVRELGPGEFIDSLTINNPGNIPFYQVGDFKLEFNLEYRFNIFWRMKGAFFVDGGNIWTIKEDPDRLGSQLLWKPKPHPNPSFPGETVGNNFFRQIAMGTGFGIRGDFTYFIIRFDLGIKMRSPYPDENGNYWLFSDWQSLTLSDGINYNLAIGYPF